MPRTRTWFEGLKPVRHRDKDKRREPSRSIVGFVCAGTEQWSTPSLEFTSNHVAFGAGCYLRRIRRKRHCDDGAAAKIFAAMSDEMDGVDQE
jgi:hypothetical protein